MSNPTNTSDRARARFTAARVIADALRSELTPELRAVINAADELEGAVILDTASDPLSSALRALRITEYRHVSNWLDGHWATNIDQDGDG